MSLPEFSIRYPVTVAMATLAVVLLGWISLDRLGIDLFPDLQTPVVTVDLRAPGKSPREIEERYTRRLEGELATVQKVRHVRSVSRSGQALVVAEFAWDADMDFALLDVQKKVGSYASDTDITSLDVTREDPRAIPVLRLAVSQAEGGDLDALLGTVELAIKPRLEALEGVASAEIEGAAEKEVWVTLDPYLLEAYGVSSETVVNQLRAADTDVSGGTLREGGKSYLVKGIGRLMGLEDIRNLIVGERSGDPGTATVNAASDGANSERVPVRIGDVGRVSFQYQERESLVRLDGAECLGMAIYKEAGANTVTVVRTVLGALSGLEKDLADLGVTVVENQAWFIEEAVGEVEDAALYGALLAVGVLLVSLRNWTPTLVIALSIPISVLATFTLMYFEGLTLNIMTLGGLALGAGMLVDNAIVVIENIYRHIEQGEDVHTAAARGASEVGVAILASTLTTVSVFLPIIYVQGVAGMLFKEQAWTVAFALISSLGVAMTAVPALSSRLLRKSRSAPGFRAAGFGRLLGRLLGRKGTVLGVSAAMLGAAVYVGLTLQTEFIPHEDQGLFQVDIATPEGTRLEVTDRVAQRVAAMIRDVAGRDAAHITIRAGTDPTRLSGASEPSGPHTASVSVLLSESPDRRRAGELIGLLDSLLAEIPDLQVNYRMHETALTGFLGGNEAPVQVEITGDNLEALRTLTEEVRTRLDALPEIYNVRSSFQGGQPEVEVKLRDEMAAAFGLNTQSVARELERRLSGQEAGTLSRDQRERTVRVRFEEVDLRELGRLRVDGSGGAVLTLQDVAELDVVEAPREILRESQKRLGRISAYLNEGVPLSRAVAGVEATIGGLSLPSGYRITMGGEERERAESFEGLKFALLLSVVLVYMVMASLFESFVHPFTVMLTVPLAGVGVVFAFGALGHPLNVMAYIGIIMLGGIAVNDAIILVDRINQLRQDAPLREAVVQAAQDRLRPILMTSATTILALLPMAFGVGEGARLRAPMAIAVIGGLVSSTLLTLVVIPAVYETLDRLRRRGRA